MADEQVPPQAEADPEPEGVVEIDLPGSPGQKVKMAPVGVLSAERKRVRESTEQKIRAEYEPIKQKAAQLEADMAAAQPYIQHVQKNWETIQKDLQRQQDVPGVSDDEAEKFARRYELFTANGLDTQRAKQMIADNRKETERIATEAALRAMEPLKQDAATKGARAHFAWAAAQKGPDGEPLVDPTALAQYWAQLPPELAANPQVAELLLDSFVGKNVRSGKRPQRTEHEPTFSEAPGGRTIAPPTFGDRERRLAAAAGMTQKQFTDAAANYKPGQSNVIGD